jgi:hypothetical protein
MSVNRSTGGFISSSVIARPGEDLERILPSFGDGRRTAPAPEPEGKGLIFCGRSGGNENPSAATGSTQIAETVGGVRGLPGDCTGPLRRTVCGTPAGSPPLDEALFREEPLTSWKITLLPRLRSGHERTSSLYALNRRAGRSRRSLNPLRSSIRERRGGGLHGGQ